MPVSITFSSGDIASIATGLETAPQEVLRAWGNDAETLLQIEIANVTQRTQDRTSGPYSTGALAASVTGQAYSNAKNGTLIAVWFNSAQQYAEWGRYYAPYQEGKPIGLDTYTRGMHHMLYDAKNDDAGQISGWAQRVGQQAADGLAGDLSALGGL